MAEHHLAPSMVGDCAEQSRVVRVAAHDTVQHDDVGRLHLMRGGGDVENAPLHPVGQTRLDEQPARLGLVPRGQLEVDGPRRATLEQLQLDVADAAPDLEHRCACHAALGHQLHDAPRVLASPCLR